VTGDNRLDNPVNDVIGDHASINLGAGQNRTIDPTSVVWSVSGSQYSDWNLNYRTGFSKTPLVSASLTGTSIGFYLNESPGYYDISASFDYQNGDAGHTSLTVRTQKPESGITTTAPPGTPVVAGGRLVSADPTSTTSPRAMQYDAWVSNE